MPLFEEFVRNQENIAFLFVNDGSTDQTLELLIEASNRSNRLQYLDLAKNSGKAEAVRQGLLQAAQNDQIAYIGFWDADLATPLAEIVPALNMMQINDFEMITGLRLTRLGAKVTRTAMRHFLGRIFATIAANILKINVYDTQCGAKLYKKELIRLLFDQPFITRWFFDVEILARYRQLFGKEKANSAIYEYPLMTWNDVQGSQLKFGDFFKAPLELLKIRKKYR
jgi:glycosyltransferase involved in cell wall biosynthesis